MDIGSIQAIIIKTKLDVPYTLVSLDHSGTNPSRLIKWKNQACAQHAINLLFSPFSLSIGSVGTPDFLESLHLYLV